ncbi:hypothetical protein Q5752_003558 [Cryptotrichosporon argae]
MPDERAPLLAVPQPEAQLDDGDRTPRQIWLGQHLEARRTHRFVLSLIALDASFVLTDVGWTVLHPACSADLDSPRWLETLSYLSLAITCLFLLEIPASLWAFGSRWFGLSRRRPPVTHAFLHLFDAVVVVGTAVFEIFLRGKERELAGLLVLLRLWRLIKLVGGVAVGVGSWDESAVRSLADARARIRELEKENAGLRARLGYGVEDA